MYASKTPIGNYGQRLVAIYQGGLLIAALGVLLALAGVFKKHSLRWLSPLSSTLVFLLWFFTLMSE